MYKIRIRPVSALVWGVLVLVLVLIGVLALLKPAPEAVAASEVQPVLVRTQTIAPHAVRETIRVPGRVVADVRAVLSVEKAGRVIECVADKGDRVHAGDVLLRVDDRHWRALEAQAQLELADAGRELARTEPMKASGAVADSAYDAIRQRYDLARVALDQALVHVAQCLLVSPFDGVVDARLIEPGEFANEGQAAFRVLDTDPLNVQVNIPERDVTAVQAGGTNLISAAVAGLGTLTGRVTFVAQDASPASFTYPVELTVVQPPAGLRPGMIVDVEIVRATRPNAIAVPLAAVIPRRGEHVVYVARDGVAVRRVVEIESLAGQVAVINRGLQIGEHLVIEGHRGLQDGVAVREDGE